MTAASLLAAKPMMAARSTSLFFTANPLATQRIFTAAISSCSDSGMVKLSRTNLAFLGLAILSALVDSSFFAASGSAAGLLVGFSAALIGALVVGLAAGFTAGFAAGLAVGFAAVFEAGDGVFGAAALLALVAESLCFALFGAELLVMTSPLIVINSIFSLYDKLRFASFRLTNPFLSKTGDPDPEQPVTACSSNIG